jgi:hypothetical protein
MRRQDEVREIQIEQGVAPLWRFDRQDIKARTRNLSRAQRIHQGRLIHQSTARRVAYFVTSTSLITNLDLKAGTGAPDFSDPVDDPVARLNPLK